MSAKGEVVFSWSGGKDSSMALWKVLGECHHGVRGDSGTIVANPQVGYN